MFLTYICINWTRPATPPPPLLSMRCVDCVLMRNVTVIVNWSPVTCYSKLFIWRTLLIVGTARADTLKSSNSKEWGRRGIGRTKGSAGGSQRSTLDEACFVVGPAFVPCAVWLVLQHQAAANGFSLHLSRPAAGCVWLCVCVLSRAHVCVCVCRKTTQKTSCATLEISVANLKLKYEERSLALPAVSCEWRGEGSGVCRGFWSGVWSLYFPLYLPRLYLYLHLCSVFCLLLCFVVTSLADFGFLFSVFFVFWHLQKASNLWRLYVSWGDGPRPLRVLDLLFMLWRNNAAVEQGHIANQAYAA